MQKITYYGYKDKTIYTYTKDIKYNDDENLIFEEEGYNEDFNVLGEDFNTIYNNYLNEIVDNKEEDNKNYEVKKNNIDIFKDHLPKNYFDLLSDNSLNERVMIWIKNFENNPNNNLLENGGFLTKIENKLIPALFYGPPGTGKTTLAKIVAKTKGYQTVIINGSDYRGLKLVDIIKNIHGTGNLYKKPILLIIDECDGILETESINVVSLIIKEIMNENNQELKIKKPIIFICNDPYTKGVKELRKICQKFKFKQPKEELVDKVKEICEFYNLKIDEMSAIYLCRDNNYDIRATLNQLQTLIQENIDNEIIKYKKNSLYKKNINSVNIYELFETIFNKNETPMETIYEIKKFLINNIDFKLAYLFILENINNIKFFNNIYSYKNFVKLVCNNLRYKNNLNDYSLKNYFFNPFYYLCLNNKHFFNDNWNFPLNFLKLDSKKRKNKFILGDIITNLDANLLINRNKNKLYKEINYIQYLLKPNIKKSVIWEKNDKELVEIAANIWKNYKINLKIIEENNNLISIYSPNIFSFSWNKNNKVVDIKTQIHIIKLLDKTLLNFNYDEKWNQNNVKKINNLKSMLKNIRYNYNEGFNDAVKYDLNINYFN